MRSILKSKKGDVTDTLLFLVIMFFLAISLVVALFANSKIKEVIDTTVLNQSAAYSSITSSFEIVQMYTVQRGFVLMFDILIIGIMVSSFLIRVHSVFVFLYIITLGSAIFVSIFLANSYALIVSNGLLADFADNYGTMTWVMQNIAVILLAVGAISMIIIFGKIGQNGGGEPDF